MGSKQSYDAEFREGAVRSVIETSGRPASVASGSRLKESERAEPDWLRREMSEKNERIRELSMERDVLTRCMPCG